MAKLGPNWEPKPSQNGAKLDPKSKQVGAWFENLLFEGCRLEFYDFGTHVKIGEVAKTIENL